ncbi:MAG: ribose-phosphate diphosphokinase [Chloroflexota bacterium]
MEIALYAGSSVPALATQVADRLGVSLSDPGLVRFPDGEVHVRLRESVRGRDVFIIQSTCPPIDQHLIELLVMLDACKRAAAGRVTAILPYYGYARQEKKSYGREPITARLVADLLTVAGAGRVLTLDIHAPAIQGFFSIEMENLTTTALLVDYLRSLNNQGAVVLAPDAGRLKVVEKYARGLDLPLAVLHKRRLTGEEVEIQQVIGDVAGRRVVIIDDIISTGSTIARAVEAVRAAGASDGATVVATHPLLVGEAVNRLNGAGIGDLVVTDTVPLSAEKAAALQARVHVLSVAGLLAEAIRCLHEDKPISPLYGPTS